MKQLTKEQADRLFIRSVKKDNIKALIKALSQGADPNQHSEHFRDGVKECSALMFALRRGQSLNLMHHLIICGAMISELVFKQAAQFIESSFADRIQRGRFVIDAYIEQQKRLMADNAAELACDVSLKSSQRNTRAI